VLRRLRPPLVWHCCEHVTDHRCALRDAKTLLSSAPRNSGKRSWTKLHHLAPVEPVLFDGLRNECEAGLVAGLHQLAGTVGLHPFGAFEKCSGHAQQK